MMDALTVDRIHFAFTATFHYLFPQLTMGLALLIVVLKTLALRTGDGHYEEAARFWHRIFVINFVVGVVTGNSVGVPVRHQLVDVLEDRRRRDRTTLAMEGVFSFFMESTFLGAFLFGEKHLGRLHWLAAFLVFLGSWISDFFIIATNAWMQHPGSLRAEQRRHVWVDEPDSSSD
jgi:cytochrome bd ubiquinol oxidase subunit I